ncbi:MAG: hypothetical protein NT129_04520 [Candidatus Aenigmarchaeota archaeon]|nr:hypothetical protein [Candidatus Aenigmarchaeota archaeon]
MPEEKEKGKIAVLLDKLKPTKEKAIEEKIVLAGEKPVGEMLKAEGIITEVAESSEKIKVVEEINLRALVMRTEKLDAQVSALKDIKFQSDERIKELAESVGELRSMLFQRDAEIKANITKVERLGEMVSDVDPEKITKELHKKDEDLDKIKAETEKLDKISHDLLERVGVVQRLFDNIKSMENLIEVTKEIDNKIAKIEQINDDSKRNVGKVEKFYLDMNRKLSQLNVFETRLSKIEDLTKELVETNDNISIQMKNSIKIEDLEAMLKAMVHIPETSNADELINQKKEIASLVKNLQDQYKGGIISEESYNEVVDKNTKILAQYEEKIKAVGSMEKATDVSSWMRIMDKSLRNIETKLHLDGEKLNELELAVIDATKGKNRVNDALNILKIKAARSEAPQQRETAPIAITENRTSAVLETDEIKSFLSSLEDEYSRGLVSESTYQEVRQRNLAKLKDMEEENAVPEHDVEPATQSSLANELNQLKNKINELKEKNIDTTELESLIKLAEKKDALGYSSLAKIYLDSIREKLMNYEWS